ncbi:uncharacterized protein LOC111342985 [Stylophora pistillata]|uniref:uncharacterized protein LOC111342985 n=1 Tax=Stylophora pistillata TaxID=50429 RepID=UPI000C04AE58|nr:uncharacterized protein LOC111342985 [Stylophora pistillata]
MKISAVLPSAFVALCIFECCVSAAHFKPGKDPRNAEYNRQFLRFPRKPEKDDHGDEEDGVVEDIEEQFDKPIKDLKNSRAFTKQYLKPSHKDPRQEEYIREHKGFPRKPEKDDHGDEEDGVVEDIEEQFDKPIKDLKNSREFTKQYLKTSHKDPRKEEYIREHKDFPRKPEKDDHGEEDGVLEDIEEPFYISMEHLANSGEFPKQNFQISNKCKRSIERDIS